MTVTCVRFSYIPGAGDGMFAHADPSACRGGGGSRVYIKARAHLCVYSSDIITPEENDALENTDYVMHSEYSHLLSLMRPRTVVQTLGAM